MHALVCMILLFFPSVSIYLLLEYSLYIAPYNLLCPSEYGGMLLSLSQQALQLPFILIATSWTSPRYSLWFEILRGKRDYEEMERGTQLSQQLKQLQPDTWLSRHPSNRLQMHEWAQQTSCDAEELSIWAQPKANGHNGVSEYSLSHVLGYLLNFLRLLQLALEQCGFELHGPIYMQIFFNK